MKRIKLLLLGDSISLGYREIVKYNLAECFDVRFPKEQGKGAADIYRMLYEWKKYIAGNEEIDLIYWNAGEWDVVHIFGEDSQTNIEEYKQYLGKIYRRLRHIFPNAKICFATTTPVVEEVYEEDFFRKNKEIELYNMAAKEVLGEKVDLFDDLYDFIKCATKKDYVDATHFSFDVNRKMANHISNEIKKLFVERIDSVSKVESLRKISIKKYIEDVIDNKKPIMIWGIGKVYDEYGKILTFNGNVKALIDRDKRLWGCTYSGITCLDPSQINKENALVVVCVNDRNTQYNIGEHCDELGVVWCTYQEYLEVAWERYENRILYTDYKENDYSPDEAVDIKKYIGVSIEENTCNLDCTYCYLRTNANRRFENLSITNPHNPKFIRRQLSRTKLGGSCLIGLTGSGETMLVHKFNDICFELLKEGHCLHIVTNGTTTDKIKELLEISGPYAKHILFKLSFHYIQLKNKSMLSKFVESVNLIRNSEASYTIEIMPHDELVPYIPELKEFCEDNFGALPHLTIGRDENSRMKLFTRMSFKEYYETWKDFNSILFDMRMNNYLMKGRHCSAGKNSLFVDLISGNISRCLFKENIGNIYIENIDFDNISEVGDACPMEACFNCHIYSALNVLPNNDWPTYYELRNRTMCDGEKWIKDEMKRQLSEKFEG